MGIKLDSGYRLSSGDTGIGIAIGGWNSVGNVRLYRGPVCGIVDRSHSLLHIDSDPGHNLFCGAFFPVCGINVLVPGDALLAANVASDVWNEVALVSVVDFFWTVYPHPGRSLGLQLWLLLYVLDISRSLYFVWSITRFYIFLRSTFC